MRRADDIDHDDDCEDIERRVTWGVEDGDTDPLTATQWRTLQQIRTAVAEMPGAHVDVRRHVARLSCRCADPSWLAARVRIVLPDLDLNVQRQYKLGE